MISTPSGLNSLIAATDGCRSRARRVVRERVDVVWRSPAAIRSSCTESHRPAAVRVLAGDDRHPPHAVAHDDVGQRRGLQAVGRCGAEVEPLVVGRGQLSRGVTRREQDDAGGENRGQHRLRDRRGAGPDDDVHILVADEPFGGRDRLRPRR